MGLDSVIKGGYIHPGKRKWETQQWHLVKIKCKREYKNMKNLERVVGDIGRHQSYMISQKPKEQCVSRTDIAELLVRWVKIIGFGIMDVSRNLNLSE